MKPDEYLKFNEGSSFAIDDLVLKNASIHIEDLGGRAFIGISTEDDYFHLEVVPTKDEYGSSICIQLIERNTLVPNAQNNICPTCGSDDPKVKLPVPSRYDDPEPGSSHRRMMAQLAEIFREDCDDSFHDS